MYMRVDCLSTILCIMGRCADRRQYVWRGAHYEDAVAPVIVLQSGSRIPLLDVKHGMHKLISPMPNVTDFEVCCYR